MNIIKLTKNRKKISSFVCNICLAKFDSGFSLKRHKRTHRSDGNQTNLQCACSAKVFESVSGLATHKKFCLHVRQKSSRKQINFSTKRKVIKLCEEAGGDNLDFDTVADIAVKTGKYTKK